MRVESVPGNLQQPGHSFDPVTRLASELFPVRDPIQTTSHDFVPEDVALLHQGYGSNGTDLSKNLKYFPGRNRKQP
jgi:hypothetical protein